MKTMFKYTLNPVPEQTLYLPAEAEICSVAEQCGNICLWALVEQDAYRTPRRIRIAATGEAFHGGGRFIGTVLMAGGSLVWHVFELPA